MVFEIDDTVYSTIDKETFVISWIRDDGRYVLVNTYDNTCIALTYHQIIHEYILVN